MRFNQHDMRFNKLPRSFYLRPTVTVARDLLGKYFVRKLGGKYLIGKIVEVEAYCEGDPASHSYRGMTERNKVMFGEGGHLYVYFTYGMHFCANVVTREKGVGEAVLIRAVEPVEGIEVMAKNRAMTVADSPQSAFHTPQLTNGPAKVCEAFCISRKHNGIDLYRNEVFIASSSSPQPARPTLAGRGLARLAKRVSTESRRTFHIGRSFRIGIRNGRDKKWRFYIKGSGWISRI